MIMHLCVSCCILAATMVNVRPGDDLVAIRDKVRDAEKPVEVLLADGVYELSDTVLLDDARDADVTWRSEHQGKAVIAGGVAFKGSDMAVATDPNVLRRLPAEVRSRVRTWRVPPWKICAHGLCSGPCAM